MPHTPGPWKVMGTEDEGFTIASCDQEGNPEEPIVWQHGGIDYRPNAVLMAAAPNLLLACQGLLWLGNNADAIEFDPRQFREYFDAAVADARAAVAMAVEPEPLPILPPYES